MSPPGACRHRVRPPLAVALLLGWLATGAPAGAAPLLSGIWYDTVQVYEPDEAVEVWNGGMQATDLSGFRITTATRPDGGVVLPEGTVLDPGARAWITQDGAAFRLAFGHGADFEVTGTDPDARQAAGSWSRLANAGSEVRLLDPEGRLVDVVAYGDVDPPAGGWIGPPARRGWDPGLGSSAIVLARARTEGMDSCVQDTDTAEDWRELRLVRPGTTFLLPASFPAPQRVAVGVAPDSTFPMLTDVLDGARSSLRLGLYSLTSPTIVERLVGAIERGVQVRLLLEGSPVGGRSDDFLWAASVLHEAGADVRWLRADSIDGTFRRHPFAHSKYVIADAVVSYVATENATPTGHPDEPVTGNRGLAVRVDDERVAAWLTAVFDEDADLRHADVRKHEPALDDPPDGHEPTPRTASGHHAAVTRVAHGASVLALRPVVSPDHSSLRQYGILGPLDEAVESIEAWQMSLPLHWGRSADPPDLQPSAPVQALIAAARRGVEVRVLLDGSWFSDDPDDPRDNGATCAHLEEIAETEGLPLSCRLSDPALLHLGTIHVKAFLVDGRVAHVGSMNGTSTSWRLNREVGVQVEDEALTAHVRAVFDRDWHVAGVGLPVPAAVEGLRVTREADAIVLSWSPPPLSAPSITAYRLREATEPEPAASFAIVAEPTSETASRPLAATPTLAFYQVTAFATNESGTVEGPNGHHSGWFPPG